jgi:hypothetical protein
MTDQQRSGGLVAVGNDARLRTLRDLPGSGEHAQAIRSEHGCSAGEIAGFQRAAGVYSVRRS